MSITKHDVQRTVGVLLALAAGQTLLTIGHFVHGAHHYDDPGRLHVVAPAAAFFVLAAALAGLYLWRPRAWTLWPFVLEVAAVDVGLFGLVHGGFNHALKDLCAVAGVGAERLAEIFDSPDFTLPDDAIYETTGLAALVLAGFVAVYLVRLVRQARRC